MNQPSTQPATDDWIVWQLIDSAFPTGGFAHSAGLEAAAQQGEVMNDATLASFFESSLLQAGRAALPLVMVCHREPARFSEVDELCDTMLRSTVANRASRAQGQAYLIAIERTFAGPDRPAAADIAAMRAQVRRDRLPGHFATAFGASAGLLRFDPMTTAMGFLFLTLRGLVSSAVRLGIIGPMQAQAMQFELSPFARWVAHRFINTPVMDAAQSAPIIDILQGGHDRLYSRLFQS